MLRDAVADVEIQVDPLLGFEHDGFVELLDYWKSKCGGRLMPARADIDPLDLKPYLGFIFLVEVEGPPYRFRYRLIGTELTEILRRDMTGRYFDEVYPAPLLHRLTEVFTRIVAERKPLRTHGQARYPNEQALRFETLNLPLAEDGERVNMILSTVSFSALDER